MKTETKDLVTNPPLIVHPELIKVLAIKKKFVDQMLKVSREAEIDKIQPEVIGRTSVYIIVRAYNGDMMKVHSSDWQTYLMRGSTDYVVSLKSANETIARYAQLFED